MDTDRLVMQLQITNSGAAVDLAPPADMVDGSEGCHCLLFPAFTGVSL